MIQTYRLSLFEPKVTVRPYLLGILFIENWYSLDLAMFIR